MPPPQLCKIEKGTSLPGHDMLLRIEQALDITDSALTDLRDLLIDTSRSSSCEQEDRISERLVAACDVHSIPDLDLQQLVAKLIPKLDRYARLEDEQCALHLCRLSARIGNCATEKDGIAQAERLRERLGVGDTPLRDVLPVLEQHNVRIVFVDDLPRILPQKSMRETFCFHDTLYRTPVICVNRKADPDSQTYGIAYELGSWLRYCRRLQSSRKPRHEEWEFCRAFASTLLIPTTALRNLLKALNIQPGTWTQPLLSRVAKRFGVSPLALVWRLESIKRIDPGLSPTFKQTFSKSRTDRISASTTAALPEDTWLNLLHARAQTM